MILSTLDFRPYSLCSDFSRFFFSVLLIWLLILWLRIPVNSTHSSGTPQPTIPASYFIPPVSRQFWALTEFCEWIPYQYNRLRIRSLFHVIIRKIQPRSVWGVHTIAFLIPYGLLLFYCSSVIFKGHCQLAWDYLLSDRSVQNTYTNFPANLDVLSAHNRLSSSAYYLRQHYYYEAFFSHPFRRTPPFPAPSLPGTGSGIPYWKE